MMSANAIIRPARASDIPAIVDLWMELMDFHAERDPWFRRSADGHIGFAEHLANCMDDARYVLLVAELDGQIVGYSLAEITQRPAAFAEREHGFITDIAVTAKCRRLGIGTRLAEETIRCLQERGMRKIVLSYASANEVSRAFWRKMGFQPYMERLRLDTDN